MKHILVLLHVFFSITLHTQPAIQWQKTLGGSDWDEAKSVQQTNDGGYILTGDVLSFDGDVSGNHGGEDFWVVKLSETGSIQWKKTFGGTGNDWPYAIQQTTEGGYIIAGHTDSNNGDVSGNHGNKDAWVLKLTSTGAIQWKKCYGGSAWEAARAIQQTADEGYVFAGIAQSTDGDVLGVHGDLDFWVVKLDGVGTIEWQKALGGSFQDIAHDIRQTSDGGYIVAGETLSNDENVSGNHGSNDYWVVKLDGAGTIEWQKALGGTAFDAAQEVRQTDDGGYIIAGYASSHNNGDVTGHHGGIDNWVVKLSSNGEILWQRTLGGSLREYGRSIEQTNDGGYIIAGETESTDGDVIDNNGEFDMWVVKLNDSGALLWQKTLGGGQSEQCFSVHQTSDGGYVLAGYTWSSDGDVSGVHGYDDFWVVKLSPESSPTSVPQALPIELFPNPAINSITVKNPFSSAMIVIITDLLGQKISRQTVQNDESIDIVGLPNGLYLLTATTSSGKVLSGKFMKHE